MSDPRQQLRALLEHAAQSYGEDLPLPVRSQPSPEPSPEPEPELELELEPDEIAACLPWRPAAAIPTGP